MAREAARLLTSFLANGALAGEAISPTSVDGSALAGVALAEVTGGKSPASVAGEDTVEGRSTAGVLLRGEGAVSGVGAVAGIVSFCCPATAAVIAPAGVNELPDIGRPSGRTPTAAGASVALARTDDGRTGLVAGPWTHHANHILINPKYYVLQQCGANMDADHT